MGIRLFCKLAVRACGEGKASETSLCHHLGGKDELDVGRTECRKRRAVRSYFPLLVGEQGAMVWVGCQQSEVTLRGRGF